MLVFGIATGTVWLILYVYSNYQLGNITAKFNNYTFAKKQSAVKKYKFALSFIKITRWTEKLLKFTLLVIIACVAPPVGFFVALAILWFLNSLKKTNYRGYNTIKNRNERQMRKLDDWVVIANQTILK